MKNVLATLLNCPRGDFDRFSILDIKLSRTFSASPPPPPIYRFYLSYAFDGGFLMLSELSFLIDYFPKEDFEGGGRLSLVLDFSAILASMDGSCLGGREGLGLFSRLDICGKI